MSRPAAGGIAALGSGAVGAMLLGLTPLLLFIVVFVFAGVASGFRHGGGWSSGGRRLWRRWLVGRRGRRIWRRRRIGKMVNTQRWIRHLFMPPWAWRRAFPHSILDAIEAAIRDSETRHSGEIRFAIENSLAPGRVWRGMSGRERAIEVFSKLRVWDTEHNSGVLIYLLLADRDIEIVADRGIAARVDTAAWEQVAQTMEVAFRNGAIRTGALAGIAQISDLLAATFSASRA